MSGLVGRVEQLLELAGKARLPWHLEIAAELRLRNVHDADEEWSSRGKGIAFAIEQENAELIVAAVNLVEPLARVALAAQRVNDRIVIKDIGDPDFELLPGSTDACEELAEALAAVSGEPDEQPR